MKDDAYNRFTEGEEAPLPPERQTNLEGTVGTLVSKVDSHDQRLDDIARSVNEINGEMRKLNGRVEERFGSSAENLRGEFDTKLREGSERQGRQLVIIVAIVGILISIAMTLLTLWFTNQNDSAESRFTQEQKRTDDRFVQLISQIKDTNTSIAGEVKRIDSRAEKHIELPGHPWVTGHVENIILRLDALEKRFTTHESLEGHPAGMAKVNAETRRLDETIKDTRERVTGLDTTLQREMRLLDERLQNEFNARITTAQLAADKALERLEQMGKQVVPRAEHLTEWKRIDDEIARLDAWADEHDTVVSALNATQNAAIDSGVAEDLQFREWNKRISDRLLAIETGRFTRTDFEENRERGIDRDRMDRESAMRRDRELSDRIAKLEALTAVWTRLSEEMKAEQIRRTTRVYPETKDPSKVPGK